VDRLDAGQDHDIARIARYRPQGSFAINGSLWYWCRNAVRSASLWHCCPYVNFIFAYRSFTACQPVEATGT